MFSSNKISQHSLNSNIPHRPSIAQSLQFLHAVKTDHICHAQYSNYIAATHNITHSPCTSKHTTHPPLPTTLQKKQKAYLCKWWQNGTRCRDGVKVLWCRSHLLWLVFDASIPTCTCFPSENVLWLVYGLSILLTYGRVLIDGGNWNHAEVGWYKLQSQFLYNGYSAGLTCYYCVSW